MIDDETIIQRAERKMVEDNDGYPPVAKLREEFLACLDRELEDEFGVLPNGATIRWSV